MKAKVKSRKRDTSPSSHASFLQLTYRPLTALYPDPKNARLHNPRQLKALAKSIRAFGFVVPIIIDKHQRIVCGHARATVAKDLGIAEVPVICLEHLSEAQLKAFMLADNRLAELATWDDRLLGETLQDLSVLDLTFDIEATGFTTGEIDLRIEGLESAGEEDPADAPVEVGGDPVSQVGDCWILGPHRLVCGSALEKETYRLLMDGARASMIFTDPPYNVRIDGHAGGKGRVKHREFAMASGEMTPEAFTAFLTTAFQQMRRHADDGALHFICMDWAHLPEILGAGEAIYDGLKNVCVWAKDRAGMGSLYRSQHELVLVFKQGAKPHINNIELGRFGRHRSNVWNYPSILSERRTEEGDLLALHPTVKPVQMVADALLDCSRRGDIVLDPFLGSGTTLLAAQRVGRACFGIELDPHYVDTAIARWQRFTGQDAVLAESGETYTERRDGTASKPPARRAQGGWEERHG